MRRLFRTTVSLLFVAGATAAAAQMPTVRIQDIDGMTTTLSRIAVEKGFCPKHGINCVLQKINSGPLAIQGVLAGSIEIATPSPEIAISASARGSDLKAIAGHWAKNSFMLITGPDMAEAGKRGYPSIIQDLKGKRIGVNIRGSAGEFLFTTMLQDQGLKPSDVTYVAVGVGNTAYQALQTRQVDAVMAFAPMDGFCNVLKTCTIAMSIGDGQGPKEIVATRGNGGMYIASRDYAAKNPKVISSFLSAMAEAERFIKDPANRDEELRITLKYFRLDMPQGEAITRDSLDRWRSAISLVPDRAATQAIADYMLKTGQLQAPVNVAKLLD
jgi:NitT/TauT family transport system substrate-binding protein